MAVASCSQPQCQSPDRCLDCAAVTESAATQTAISHTTPRARDTSTDRDAPPQFVATTPQPRVNPPVAHSLRTSGKSRWAALLDHHKAGLPAKGR